MDVALTPGRSPHATRVTVGSLVLVFSYSTVVAFYHPETGWVASVNVWSATTGKHLNQEVPEGVERTAPFLFAQRLQRVLSLLDEVTT